MDLAAGTLVDGKYRVVRPIGRGGMGAVYEVENVRIRKTVAMKLLSANAAEDVVRRFEKEAQAAGQIGSEHIVEVHDLGTMPSGEPYMVMELLEGETLRQRLHREKRLSVEAAVPLLVQVLEGLSAAHAAGIVHRDLKPENIYLCSQRGGLRDWVKVLDFGISKFASVSEDGMTKTGQVIGTPQYMAPEQIKAPQTVDGRTDLYAVGVIFYQLLTGHIPFKAKTYAELLFKVVYEPLPHPTTFVPDLDREACEIVLTAMSRDPAGRFANAAAFRDRLVQLGTRLGSASAAPTDPMRAFLVASNAGLPRPNVGDGGVPPPTPSRPHGVAPSFAGSPTGPSAPFGPQAHVAGFATPGPAPGTHHTPGSQPHPSVPGSTPWPGSGTSWPSGPSPSHSGAAPGAPHPGGRPFGPQAFGPPGMPEASDDGGHGSFQQAATQLFPMSSSSPSHPSLSASMSAASIAQRAGALAGSMNAQAASVPTPNPSFGGVPVQDPTHTLATGGRKTAVLVASAVFAVGLGATAFVATRTSTPVTGSLQAPSTEIEAKPSPMPTPTETAAPPTPEPDEPKPAASGAAATPSTTPSAIDARPVPPTSATPKTQPQPPGPRPPPKPKKDFGY
jgi:serine/threonine protein kinase